MLTQSQSFLMYQSNYVKNWIFVAICNNQFKNFSLIIYRFMNLSINNNISKYNQNFSS